MGNLKVEKNEKICKNCKYYLEHYIKEEIFLLPIGGHRINVVYAIPNESEESPLLKST
jgi:hypothetical protein